MSLDAETCRFGVGRFSCLTVKDGGARYPVAMFLTNIDKRRYEPLLRQRGEDTEFVDLPYLCLVIDTRSTRVLVDTGVGAYGSGGRLISLLRREGIEPDTIDIVVLSHGHPDHVGGTVDAEGRAAFANARYVMFRKEWDFWTSNPTLAEWPIDESMKKGALACVERSLSGVRDSIDLVEPGAEIAPGIEAIAAFGHSPGHMALAASSNGERLLFAADAVALPLHFEFPEALGLTDHCPRDVPGTRVALLERAARDGSLLWASHLPFPGVGSVTAHGGRRWEWRRAF